jgi:hypothetical protein
MEIDTIVIAAVVLCWLALTVVAVTITYISTKN